MQLRRIYPDGATLTPDEAMSGLRLGELAPADRPYVVANMITTVDGRATIGGRSGAIGDEADRELFRHLRTQVDAILVGTGTLRTERYGRVVRDAGLRDKRAREGLEPDPLACVVTRTLNVPFDIPLFQDDSSTVVLYTASDAPVPDCPADIRVTRMPEAELGMASALRRLRADHGVRSVLCEGGPTVLGALLGDGVLDELFFALSPMLAGNPVALGLIAGEPLEDPVELRLLRVLEADGYLFLRYAVNRATSESTASA